MRQTRSCRFAFSFLLFSYCLLIFCLSHTPNLRPPAPEFIPHLDKLLHFIAYAIMAGFAYLTFFQWRVRSLVLTSIFFCVIYGATDEFHQSFIPGRETDFFDLVADTLGAATSALLFQKKEAAIFQWIDSALSLFSSK